jgi:hypothetical protein
MLEISTREIISKMNEKVMVRCFGLMAAIIKEIGIKEYKKAKVTIQ